MRSSSPSQSHSSPPPIKARHRQAKIRAPRRRRIDLPCGCSIYRSINCHNHGFTHRGRHWCSSMEEWRIYMGDTKSPIFQNPQPRQHAVQHEPRHHRCPDSVQLQPEESTGDAQVFSQLPDLDSFTSSDLAFLQNL
ncbi:transcription activator protein [East African cassava mosaic Cameroon virus-Cameroon]|nr:transcription activator protein [East African cassava mosaic Cameroon virus-Cameroon]